MSTGNPSAPVGVNLSQQNLGQAFAAGGGNVSTALQKNVSDVGQQLGAAQVRQQAAAKTTASKSSSSTILTQPDFGFAKKTLLGT